MEWCHLFYSKKHDCARLKLTGHAQSFWQGIASETKHYWSNLKHKQLAISIIW